MTCAYKFLLPLCLLFAPSIGLAREPASASPAEVALESVLTTQVNGWIVIDAQGRLADIRIDTQIPENLRESLVRNTGKWRFHPVVVDGAARTTRARIRFVLAARQQGPDFRVSVDNVVFPNPEEPVKGSPDKPNPAISAIRLTPPRYPKNLQAQNVSGMVLMGLRLGRDGTVEQAVPVQSALLNATGRPKFLRRALEQLEESTLLAAKTWHFTVPATTQATIASEMTAVMPVYFTMQGAPVDKPGLWRTELRAPRREMDWLARDTYAQKVGVSDLANGEIMPVASAMRLASDVIGKDLL